MSLLFFYFPFMQLANGAVFNTKYLSPFSITLCQKAYLYSLKLTTETISFLFFTLSVIGLLRISSICLMLPFIAKAKFHACCFTVT